MITLIDVPRYEAGQLPEKLMILKIAFYQLDKYFRLSSMNCPLDWVGTLLDFSLGDLRAREEAHSPYTLKEVLWLESLLSIMKNSLVDAERRINLSDEEQSLFLLANPTLTYAAPAV